MIPIENSIAGRVADIHVLLPRTTLQIVGEFFLPIRFDLLGIPGSTIGNRPPKCTATSTPWASAGS